MSSNFVTQLACGSNHCLLLTSSGFLYSFGSGSNGRLGLGDEEDRDEPCMIYSLLEFVIESVHCTKDSNVARCVIRNEMPVAITYSQADSDEPLTTLIEPYHNILYSWGKGDSECLGHGNDRDITVPTPIAFSIEESVTKVATGDSHVFALDLKNGQIYSWGKNNHGQLAAPPTVKIYRVPTQVTGIGSSSQSGNKSKVVDIFCNSNSSACITERELTAGVKFEEIFSWGQQNDDKHAPKKFLKWDSVTSMTFAKNCTYMVTKETIELNTDIQSPFKLNMKCNNQNRIEIKTLDDEDFDEMDDCEIEIDDDDVMHHNLHNDGSSEQIEVEVDTEYVIIEGSPQKSQHEPSPSKQQNSEPKQPKLTGDELIKEWENEILPHFDKLRDTEKVKNMLLDQVPNKLRGNIWRVSSGNPASISQDYYQLLACKGERLSEIVLKKVEIERSGQPEHDSEYLRTKIEYNMMVMKPGVSHEDSVAIIENDLPRTFPTVEFYNQETDSGKNHVEQLRRILRAFTVMRPDIGYVQGMSYLAGFLLLENNEFQTFVLFHNLIIKSQILTFYKFEANDIIQRLKFFRQAFLVEIPDL